LIVAATANSAMYKNTEQKIYCLLDVVVPKRNFYFILLAANAPTGNASASLDLHVTDPSQHAVDGAMLGDDLVLHLSLVGGKKQSVIFSLLHFTKISVVLQHRLL
jgi:hypothetical protein